jgi:uncharacterized protein YbbC (DUF1343 family)
MTGRATKILFLLLFICLAAKADDLVIASERIGTYLPLLKNKRVALVVNHTSMVKKYHLVDTLMALKVDLTKIFAADPAFRGTPPSGSTPNIDVDGPTGLAVIPLYGEKRKPEKSDLKDVDVMVFDIQDIGVRYYTHIATLHYVMEACAEQGKMLIVLDRPNPNGYFIDGPVLEKGFKSAVGMHPVPIAYGMTIGEYAQMINGEEWISKKCSLQVIPMEGYNHEYSYALPIAPNPNLSTMEAILLYPSLGLFEGTDVSVGRGTDMAFEVIGKPGFSTGNYTFTPKSIPGKSMNPPYKGMACKGYNVRDFAEGHIRPSQQLYLNWLDGFLKGSLNKEQFFNSYFDKLAGTDQLRKDLLAGKSIDKIRASWQPGIEQFKKIREKYLLYQ